MARISAAPPPQSELTQISIIERPEPLSSFPTQVSNFLYLLFLSISSTISFTSRSVGLKPRARSTSPISDEQIVPFLSWSHRLNASSRTGKCKCARAQQNQQNNVCPVKTHSSPVRVFAVGLKEVWVLSYP